MKQITKEERYFCGLMWDMGVGSRVAGCWGVGGNEDFAKHEKPFCA